MDFDSLSLCTVYVGVGVDMCVACPDARELYGLYSSVARVVIFTERAVYHFVECNIHLNPYSHGYSTPCEHYIL